MEQEQRSKDLADVSCFNVLFLQGVNPFTLKGRNIAVIVGTINSESEILYLTHDGLMKGGFGIQGHSQALIANRVSYFFNFTGKPTVFAQLLTTI